MGNGGFLIWYCIGQTKQTNETNKQTNETNKQSNKQTNKQTNKRTNETNKRNKQTNKRTKQTNKRNKQTIKQTNKRTNETNKRNKQTKQTNETNKQTNKQKNTLPIQEVTRLHLTKYYSFHSKISVDRCGSVGIATELRAGRSGDRTPVGKRFSAPVQSGPGVHPASCTMGTGSFAG